jgi:hypothetical protein
MGKSTGKSPARSPGRASSPAKGKKKVQHFSKYHEYATGMQGKFHAHAENKKSAKVFYLRFKGFKGVKIMRRTDGFVFEHPDNKKNLIEMTNETFASAMARARQGFELARGKQPNSRMKGKSAKEGFHKNVKANNDAYDPDGDIMNQWTKSIYWGTNESRGTSGTVNESGFDFIQGKTVLGDEDGAAFDKRDFGIEDMEREVCNLGSDSEGEEEDDEMEDEDEDSEDSEEEVVEDEDSEEEVVEEEVVEEEEEDSEEEDDSEEEEDDSEEEEDGVEVMVEQQEDDDDDDDSDDDSSSEDDDCNNNPLRALQLAMQQEPLAPPQQVPQVAPQAKDISIKSLKSIVRKAKGSKKVDLMKSAIEVGTTAQLKNLHKSLGLVGSVDNPAEVKARITASWGF